MSDPALDVDRLLRLWTAPPLDADAAEGMFREFYNDPVSINGEPVGTLELVARARARRQAWKWPDVRVLSVVESGRQVVVVHRLRGRQVGTLQTSVGPLPPTGRVVQLRTIDVLTLADRRIREVWTVDNELEALAAVGAAGLLPRGLGTAAPPVEANPWEIGVDEE